MTGAGYLEVAEAIRRALAGGASAPRRAVLEIPGGRFLVMPAADERLALAKLVTVRPAETPSVHAELWVRRLDTGEVLHLPAEELTVRRTAALSLLAARTLAPRREGALLLVGAGRQARGHLEAFAEGLSLTRVLVKGRSRGRTEALLEAARALGLPAEPFSGAYPEDLAFVVTATTSREPVVSADLPEGVFVAAVGSFTPEARELPAGLIERAELVVADTADALAEAGELIGLPPGRVRLLAEVLSDPPRPRGTVVFKSTGHAIFDLAAVRASLGLY